MRDGATIAVETAATRLRDAYQAGPVPPLRDILNPNDSAGAYAVQAVNTEWWIKAGRRIVGRKIGLTAKAVQSQLGVDQPDYGVLFDDMRVPHKGTVRRATFLQPKVEGEVAFIFGDSVGDAKATVSDIQAAIRSVAPAIEIVDSRIADWKITFADTVADNGSSAGFAIGPEVAFRPEHDLFSCGMVLEVDDQVVSLGAGAACLGHPLVAARWLISTLASRGEPIRAGDIVLTGALGPMVPLKSASKVRATIGGIGSVEFSCV